MLKNDTRIRNVYFAGNKHIKNFFLYQKKNDNFAKILKR
jgi:hypothetical protein